VSLDCRDCGACCAYSESWPAFIGDGDGADIPDELVDFEHGRMLCHGSRCAALVGRLGIKTHCSVYTSRPLVCREFETGSEDCFSVRRQLGLAAP